MSVSRWSGRTFAVGIVVFAEPVLAHSLSSDDASSRASVVASALVMLLCWLLYLIGCWRRPPRFIQSVVFHAALSLGLLAIVGPLDALAQTSSAWHMVQHMLFLVVISPLWVISQPLPQFAAGGGRLIAPLLRPLLRSLRYPLLIAYAHGFVILFWHMPEAYALALSHPWWHVAEHGLFLITAGLFWWVVLRGRHQQIGWILVALLSILMMTGLLGAVLTFADTPLYGDARGLEDQQLAGLIMWVLGSIPYFMAAGWSVYRWSRQIDRRNSIDARLTPSERVPDLLRRQ